MGAGRYRSPLPPRSHAPLLRAGTAFPSLGAAPALEKIQARGPRGPDAAGGARQAVLLPPLRADLRSNSRRRDAGHPCRCGRQVRVLELLLPTDDSRRVLRRAPPPRAGRRVCRGTDLLLPVRPRHRGGPPLLQPRGPLPPAVGGGPCPPRVRGGGGRGAARGA